MSNITSSFAQVMESEIITPVTSLAVEQSKPTREDPTLQEIQEKNKRLSDELLKSRECCIELQHQVNELCSTDSRSVDEMASRLKEKQAKIDTLQQQLSSLTSNYELVIDNIKDALTLDKNAEVCNLITLFGLLFL